MAELLHNIGKQDQSLAILLIYLQSWSSSVNQSLIIVAVQHNLNVITFFFKTIVLNTILQKKTLLYSKQHSLHTFLNCI